VDWDGFGWEYKSKFEVFGLPLVHISFKYRRNRTPVVAKGIISIGQIGIGFFSLGQLTIAYYALAQIAFANSLMVGSRSWPAIRTVQDRSLEFFLQCPKNTN